MRQTAEFRSQIKADKFYPPQVDTPQFLYRERVVDHLLHQSARRLPVILVEAQAGQGKTTVIKQFLNRTEIASVWYQVGPEDADPVLFLQAILACVNRLLPDCPSAATVRALTENDFTIFDLENRISLLLNDLNSCLDEDLYIVFDDLHELISWESSLFVLNRLLETAPPKLHFILSSREPLPLNNLRSIARKRGMLRLGNRHLVLDESETTDLFHQVLGLDLSQDAIREIARTTDGWFMGVLLLGLQIKQQKGTAALPALVDHEEADGQVILRYFRREIFSFLEPRLHRSLLVLSLLDEIPVDLAIELTAESQIGADLDDLARRNLFVRRLDPEGRIFVLHQLFRQSLYEKALTELGPEAVHEMSRRAGEFCARQKDPAQALRYLQRAEAYDAVEFVLAEHGMSFLEINRTATLAAFLEKIPEECLQRQPWSSFFLALANLDLAPVRALPLLDQALAVFSGREDLVGELLCLAHIISIHITTTGDYRDGADRLIRAERLFSQATEILPPSMTVLIARSLAMGYGIFLGDMSEAGKFASTALNLARKEGMVNFEAALLMVMGYIQILAGHYAAARPYLEEAETYVHRPEVGTFNGLVIRLMLFDFLFHEGDFGNYFDQKNQLVEAVGSTLFSQSVAGPFCHVLEMNIAIHRGDAEDVLALADQALTKHPLLSPHFRSQILQFKALALALGHQPEKALAAAEESARLRKISGGPYFLCVNNLVVGLTHVHCNRRKDAIELFGEGIGLARQMPSGSLEACGLLHRAAAYLETGAHEQAGRDLELGLGLMRRNGYRNFWAWVPETMQRTLAYAVTHGIEPDYARALAADRLGLDLQDDGRAIPRLDIRTLGDLSILCRGTLLIQAQDLTPQQRELLSLLLAAPAFKLPQETIQYHFWPDSPPDTVKVKLDTLVSRLRKTFADALKEDTAHLYIRREKGMLWLAHCRIDAVGFLDAVSLGLRHFRLQEHWQAGNAFTLADSLWRGEFAPGVCGENQIRAFRDKLTGAMVELTIAWSGLLADSGRLPQAIRVAEKALSYAPLNDLLYALLYRLQGQRSAVLAKKVLRQLTDELHNEGYSTDEIAELITAIKVEPTP
ncbi:BTAD domain-containing putative transcriptional regulator [Geopsychrobacter electrodiphilus]|uniref:BTAD domain-containing putative transcriptional regulator n=1 Tax=Geopsychrobacter electrodiphilus TaxID=225196 RepID=UPI000382E42D|nr:BTAD domain-containing putative transcriptional regulator [Geopsychrobacter electrodiphilus]